MSVEDDTGLCHVTRLMKMTARARGHTIFEWSTIVTILHRFRDSPHTHSDLKSRKFHTTPVFEALLGVTPVRIL